MKKKYLVVKSTNLSHEVRSSAFVLNDNLTGWSIEQYKTNTSIGSTVTLYFKNPTPNATIRLHLSFEEFLILVKDCNRTMKAQCNGTLFEYSVVEL